jgi:hypothetical protein
VPPVFRLPVLFPDGKRQWRRSIPSNLLYTPQPKIHGDGVSAYQTEDEEVENDIHTLKKHLIEYFGILVTRKEHE